MARKKRGRKRSSWKSKLSKGLQAAAALFPEERAIAETWALGDWSKLPNNWVLNRIGYDYAMNKWDLDRAIANNAISIGGPMLIRYAMRGVK